MKAVLYARVSSAEQEREGYSIPAQITLIEEYAQKHGYTIVKSFIESETAKKTGRKEFNAMVQFLDTHSDVPHVLVEKTDRLYRNLKDYIRINPEEKNIRIHFVKENQILDHDSKSDAKFMHHIQLAMAKRYVDSLSEEVQKGMRAKAEAGHYPSFPPLGYTGVGVEGKRLMVLDQDRAPYIKKAFELAATGNYSFQKIAEIMGKEGLRSRKGHPLSKSCIQTLLSRELYKGTFTWRNKPYIGSHVPLISPALFERVQEAMQDRSKPKLCKHSFTYSGMFRCGHHRRMSERKVHLLPLRRFQMPAHRLFA